MLQITRQRRLNVCKYYESGCPKANKCAILNKRGGPGDKSGAMHNKKRPGGQTGSKQHASGGPVPQIMQIILKIAARRLEVVQIFTNIKARRPGVLQIVPAVTARTPEVLQTAAHVTAMLKVLRKSLSGGSPWVEDPPLY